MPSSPPPLYCFRTKWIKVGNHEPQEGSSNAEISRRTKCTFERCRFVIPCFPVSTESKASIIWHPKRARQEGDGLYCPFSQHDGITNPNNLKARLKPLPLLLPWRFVQALGLQHFPCVCASRSGGVPRMTTKRPQNDLKTTLKRCQNDLKTMFGVVLRSFCGRFGVVLWWLRGLQKVVLGSVFGRFGVISGSLFSRELPLACLIRSSWAFIPCRVTLQAKITLKKRCCLFAIKLPKKRSPKSWKKGHPKASSDWNPTKFSEICLLPHSNKPP